MWLHNTLVSLPPEIQLALGALVTFVVTFLLNQIALLWPWLADYLGQYKDVIITAVSAALVAWISNLLNLIPAQYEPIVNAALVLVVAILALFGLPFVTFKYFKKHGVKAFR